MIDPSENRESPSRVDNKSVSADVDALAEEFAARLRRGEFPSIGEYVEKYPALADQIRDLFPTLAMLEKCGAGEAAPEAPLAARHSIEVPEQLGEYRIIREIGRGGMGVVFEAQHDTLRRRVALKVLPAGVAGKYSHLERFYREARSAGRLHHTNIVPVFDVGADQGFHFYAMQFIHGQSLDLVFDELRRLKAQLPEITEPISAPTVGESASTPETASAAWNLVSGHFESPAADADGPGAADASRSEPVGSQDVVGLHLAAATTLPANSATHAFSSRPPTAAHSSAMSVSSDLTGSTSRESYYHRVARIGHQIAEALSFAHRHGILHRDIKPSNIILDTAGTAWITDFGLAKHEGENLTHTGDIVGTLRYMAPERFAGQADARSDVYGLGLTLYELCTLKEAYSETDRVRLMSTITHQDPTRPSKVQPQIPRDLETILVKAIDRQPGRRYQTAQSLADDLSRFLSDRPISARRILLLERGWRWCRRNPVIASLVGCIFLLMTVVVVGSIRFALNSRSQAAELRLETQRARDAEHEARLAETAATKSLYASYLGRAESVRWSGRIGQQFTSLESIRQAVSLLPMMRLDNLQLQRERLELRNLAVAALALVDLKVTWQQQVEAPWVSHPDFDHRYERFAQSDERGNLRVQRTDGQGAPIILPSPGEQAWKMGFSQDGQYLVSKHHHRNRADAPLLVVWHLSEKRATFQISADLSFASFCLSPDNREIAIGRRRGAVDFYALDSGTKTSTIHLGFDPWDLAFDHEGRQLAVADPSSSVVQIWTVTAGEEPVLTKTLETPSTVSKLAWNSQRSLLAVGTTEGELLVWHDDALEQPPWQLERHLAGNVVRLAIHPDGDLLISYAWDGTTRVHDLTTRSQVLRIDGEMPLFSGFSRDGSKIGFELEGEKFGIWALPNRKPMRTLSSDRTPRDGAVFHPQNERLMAAATWMGVELWDVQVRQLVTALATDGRTLCQFTPDGTALMTSGPQGVYRWPVAIRESGDSACKVTVGTAEQIFDNSAQRIGFDAAGTKLAVDAGNSLVLIDLHRPGSAETVASHPGLDHVWMTPDANHVVTSTWQGKGVRVWETQTGRLIRALAEDWQSTSIAASPDGKYLAGSSGWDRAVWDTATWEPVRIHARVRPDGWPGPVAFASRMDILATARSRYLPQLENVVTGETLVVLDSRDSGAANSFAFSRRDRFLAIGSERYVRIWDLMLLRSHLAELGLDWAD